MLGVSWLGWNPAASSAWGQEGDWLFLPPFVPHPGAWAGRYLRPLFLPWKLALPGVGVWRGWTEAHSTRQLPESPPFPGQCLSFGPVEEEEALENLGRLLLAVRAQCAVWAGGSGAPVPSWEGSVRNELYLDFLSRQLLSPTQVTT